MSRKGNRGKQQPQPRRAAAQPKMMIEVQIAGMQGTQILPVDLARDLRDELDLALASLDEVPQGDDSTPDETAQPNQSETPDDQSDETQSVGAAVDGADAPPAV